MLIGKVESAITATVKDPSLVGSTMLRVRFQDGGEILALDTVGAGTGDLVIVTTGSGARIPSQAAGTPVDASIIAIVDGVVPDVP